MQRSKLLTTCVILISLSAYSERISGICSIKLEPDGEQVAELTTGTYIIAHSFNKSYDRIIVACWVRKRQQYDGIRLEPKAILYDDKHQKIGKVLRPFNPMRQIEENDSMAKIWINALVERASIDQQTVPELALSNLLMKADLNAKFDYFSHFLKDFQFDNQVDSGLYSSWIIQEVDFVKQKFEPRILMIFYKNELIAVFHNRPIQVKLYDSIEMGNAYKMIYNSKFTEHTKGDMMKIYKHQLELDQ